MWMRSSRWGFFCRFLFGLNLLDFWCFLASFTMETPGTWSFLQLRVNILSKTNYYGSFWASLKMETPGTWSFLLLSIMRGWPRGSQGSQVFKNPIKIPKSIISHFTLPASHPAYPKSNIAVCMMKNTYSKDDYHTFFQF